MSLIFGIDPDSAGFPLARYHAGALLDLQTVSTPELAELLRCESSRPDLIVIEDVLANKGIYARNDHGSRRFTQQISQRVGMCKQMQVVAQSIAEHYGVPVIAVRPTKRNWAKNKPLFEKATGWTGQSNEDTRSAAYFGFLHKDFSIKTSGVNNG
jgi:hypothetical protein